MTLWASGWHVNFRLVHYYFSLSLCAWVRLLCVSSQLSYCCQKLLMFKTIHYFLNRNSFIISVNYPEDIKSSYKLDPG